MCESLLVSPVWQVPLQCLSSGMGYKLYLGIVLLFSFLIISEADVFLLLKGHFVIFVIYLNLAVRVLDPPPHHTQTHTHTQFKHSLALPVIYILHTFLPCG